MHSSLETVFFIFSIVAVVFSVYTFLSSRRDSQYQDLDGLYLEALKLGMDNPRFINPGYTKKYKEIFQDDELHKYQVFAYIIWNICETIADRRKDKNLYDTWKPVILAENKLHRAWLDNPENHHRFKKSFFDFVRNELPKT